ncbi:MAG: hypothetical protein LBS81_04865 [Endomicrobium sp.]|jgi:hypothetical protein|nr:hypothetical protein [Endomicrobium sp.]
MIQKQIVFLNYLIITASIVFVIIFFIPVFTIDIPLDYKINDNNLIINAENLNVEKDLFVKFEKNMIIVNHHIGNLKINKLSIQSNQITLDMRRLNMKNDLKIFYRFKKNVISYILKNKKI